MKMEARSESGEITYGIELHTEWNGEYNTAVQEKTSNELSVR